MFYFLKLDHCFGTFGEKMSYTLKNLKIQKSPHFQPKLVFYQNDSEWPEMDFKHNLKNCNIN